MLRQQNMRSDEEDSQQIPQEIDLQHFEKGISQNIRDLIQQEEQKEEKKNKNRLKKQRRKQKQYELECGLEKIVKYIVMKKLTVKSNKQGLQKIMESFVGKGIRFFQILDHVIKKQLDDIISNFKSNFEQSDEIYEQDQCYQKHVFYYKGIMILFYKELEKLELMNIQIASFLKLYFNKCPSSEKEKKYSMQGLIRSQFIYLLQQCDELRESVRIWKSILKNSRKIQMSKQQNRILDNQGYDQYYGNFQMLESESKKQQLTKPKKKKKNKNKQKSIQNSNSLDQIQQNVLNEQEEHYKFVLNLIQNLGAYDQIQIILSESALLVYQR